MGQHPLDDSDGLGVLYGSSPEFSPTIGAAIAAQHWHLWVRCPGCCSTQSIDLRRLDWHPDAMVTGELREEHRRRVLGE
jgi:hypothetical protein